MKYADIPQDLIAVLSEAGFTLDETLDAIAKGAPCDMGTPACVFRCATPGLCIAVHLGGKDNRVWSITHVRSGAGVAFALDEELKYLALLVPALAQLGDWTRSHEALLADAAFTSWAREAIDDYYAAMDRAESARSA